MSSEDSEFTAAQYARLHGLSVDHLADPQPTSHIEALRESVPETLTNDTDLPRVDLLIHIDTQETLTLDKAGAELLQRANNGLSTPEELEIIFFSLLDTRQTKKLRLEAPLLRTDHESDFIAFARWEGSHFRDGCLPWEPLDDEMDVGLEWPKRLKDLPATLLKDLESEKIEMLKDTMVYLQTTIKGTWTAENDREVWESATSYKRNTALEPVTPPLLPLFIPSAPYIPSSPACHLPLLSDPASLISEDLRNAEQAIFEQDSLMHPAPTSSPLTNSSTILTSHTHIKPSDAFLLTGFPEGEDQFPISSRIKIEDHKVEVPLMPAMPTHNFPKMVTFNDVVEEMLLDPLSVVDHSESFDPESDEGCKFFQEAFGDAADNATRSIEQEQLQQADTKDRVQVPIMDFGLPDPPWKFIRPKDNSVSVMEVQKAMVADVQEQYGRPPLWQGINNLIPKLRWTVFPSELARVALEESFGDDEVLHNYLEQGASQLVVDSDKLTWKPSGFRILTEDADDDEDDLEVGSFETEKSTDVASLARKRKLHYEEESFKFDISAKPSAMAVSGANIIINLTSTEEQKSKAMMLARSPMNKAASNMPKAFGMSEQKSAHDRGEQINPLLDGPFSASNALDNFLEIRASKKQKPTQSAYFADSSSNAGQTSKSVLINTITQPTLNTEPRTRQQPLPIPPGNPPFLSAPYIISSAILKHRLLIRTLNSIFPAATLIERDFTTHNRTAWMPNSITRSPVVSALDSEADFVISPSTGIIITSLQKIKQKPLPGQKSKSAFKERIEKVSVRYERLVVLVSEACADESTNGLAEADTLALAEAIGFCGSLDASIILRFIGGGEETLAKWLVAIMVQYGSQGEPSVLLLEDETLWELFLRRAGMNAYAAQVLITDLRAPDGVDVESGSKAGLFGVTAFVEMGQEERVARFERLLGGRRILQRVGRVLDASWT